MLALQRSAGNRSVAAALAARPQPLPPSPAPAADAVPVQRHASWEHKMLGDVDPDTLEVIAGGRDLPKTLKGPDRAIAAANVVHAIDQEIRRLQYFKSTPPDRGGEGRSGQARRPGPG